MTDPLLPPEPSGVEPRASAAPGATYETASARIEAIIRRLDSGGSSGSVTERPSGRRGRRRRAGGRSCGQGYGLWRRR